jgi:hypothetical protein
MKKSIASFVVVSVVFVLNSAFVRAEENVIFKELVKTGVPLSNGKTVKLPAPVMADGLNEAAQLQVMTGLIEARHLDSFLKGGLSDWFELKKSEIRGTKPQDSLGRQIDLYFVAQGKLETVASQDFTKKILTSNDPKARGKAEFFTDGELKERKLTVTNTEHLKERYAHEFNSILGQVEVRGTGRGIQSIETENVTVADKLDPRFVDDPQYPNEWQSISTVNGQKRLGALQKYSGMGGYSKVTKLQGSEDRVFVEYHLVFDEPYGWFKGGPNLIAHLDDIYPKDVRKFRRELSNAQLQK